MVWRTEGDDPLWQERWRALPPPDRARIAAAARSGSLLILGGLAADAGVFLAFGALFLLIGLFRLYRAHQVGRSLRETIARARHY
jgi:hypothetical protein